MTTNKNVLDVPVEFGGVSIGDTTARLGITVARGNMGLETADDTLVKRRLTVDVILGRKDDQSGQKTLMDDLDLQVSSVADTKGIRITGESIGAGLTFRLRDIDIASLAKLSKGTGRLVVHNVADIPEAEPKTSKPPE